MSLENYDKIEPTRFHQDILVPSTYVAEVSSLNQHDDTVELIMRADGLMCA